MGSPQRREGWRENAVRPDRQGQRRAGEGSKATRPARRHARHLGRRIRPHADGRGKRRFRTQTRPRPSSPGVHRLDGRWRRAPRRHPRRDRRTRLPRHPKDKVHVHDLHATILHLLGFNHEKLTFRFQGRDYPPHRRAWRSGGEAVGVGDAVTRMNPRLCQARLTAS